MTSLPNIEGTARCLFPPQQSLAAREGIGREPVQYREMPLAGTPQSKADLCEQDIPWDSFDADTLQRIFRALAEKTG